MSGVSAVSQSQKNKVEKQQSSMWRQTILPFLSLFTSVGTLLCCALPALLVTFGLGAALAGFVSAVPRISAVSEYKEIVFAVAGLLIAFSAFMQWRARNAPCPVDPKQAKLCMTMRKISLWITLLSAVIYLIGFFFAFLAADLFFLTEKAPLY